MIISLLSLVFMAQSIAEKPLAEQLPPSPAELYGELFVDVAEARLYEPKDWVDLRPRAAPSEILRAYEEAGPLEGAALLTFTQNYFAPPRAVGEVPDLPPNRTLTEHIDLLWPALTREVRAAAPGSSLLPLQNRYIVPGGRFREVYYWDSYFTLLGLDDEDLKRSIADNFAGLIERYGFVPNANRTYYLSRSQPPFFFLIVSLLSDRPEEAFADYIEPLKKEHAFWTGGGRVVALEDGASLARYWDAKDTPRDESYVYDVETASETDRPASEVYRELRAAAESGWDFSSRWFAEGGGLETIRTTELLPVDLNSLLYGLEEAISRGCRVLEDDECAADYADKAKLRGEAVRSRFWSEEEGYFADYDLTASAPTGQITAATAYPLFFGIASEEQAEGVAAAVGEELLVQGGLLTTTLTTGQQWDAPNGWAPMQWIAVQGLRRYGHDDLAREIAERWVRTVARGFCESGKLVEKYDVLTEREGGGGEYPTQDGFGWTNGVTAAFLDQDEGLAPYGQVTVAAETGTCPAQLQTAE
ncbi:alpha,alpha-trehalase TreF [Parvularcula maris]|uniref:Alpha,alpha-trehalase TreF n=1 Tax=Parvularcula maris TaxID=2965077 RepID=A0A9X2LB51_9PROT|nr:alpha,alpha-trehalase TreF [Parvularcula maris]MCQ8186455.1 alpha,alpha-trehalase TreF [Parvularcula maris]